MLKKNGHILEELAQRIKDPAKIGLVIHDQSNPDPLATPPLKKGGVHRLSLSQGYPGLLIFFSVMEKIGIVKPDEDISHQYVLVIKEIMEGSPFNLTLFGGLSGICFALQQASMNGTRYQRMINSLHQLLLERIQKDYLQPIENNIKAANPTSSRLYDCISGISGIGRYILEHISLPQFLSLAEKIARALIDLCQPIFIDGHHAPGWYVTENDPLNLKLKSRYPKGNFNLGLAHGVPGILAFLSIASIRGVVVERQNETIAQLSHWIRSHSFIKDNTINWPTMISWEEEIEKMPPLKTIVKDAWCYGVPGIARSLFLAGKALKSEELRTFATQAFRGIFLRKRGQWNLPAPTICHGISGLLMITQVMAKEEGCEDLTEHIEDLNSIVLNYYRPEYPFGFKDIEITKQGKFECSKVGFLEGVIGILLTLSLPFDQHPNWHLPFLIHH